MMTAEEFFRNKLRELYPNKKEIILSGETITAEQGMKWAHEYSKHVTEEEKDNIREWLDGEGYVIFSRKDLVI